MTGDLGLTDVVEWLGAVPVDDVPRLLERATVVAVPSRYEEPFGLVAVEAGLAGRPVVASDVGGLPEVVRTTAPASWSRPRIRSRSPPPCARS